jgi:hypothetical protein
MDQKNKSGYPANRSEAIDTKEYRSVNKGFPSKPISETVRNAHSVFFGFFHTILYPYFKHSSTRKKTYIKGAVNAAIFIN